MKTSHCAGQTAAVARIESNLQVWPSDERVQYEKSILRDGTVRFAFPDLNLNAR